MTLERLLSLPRLNLIAKKFVSKYNYVFDIVIYGSTVRGKTKIRDVDVALICREGVPVGEKLELAQIFKTQIKPLILHEIDVKCISLSDLTDQTFMARAGILAEGYSLLEKNFISARFGFEPRAIFVYSLAGLSNSKKTIFQYVMKGRRGQTGLLASRDCKHLGSGAIAVPLVHSEEFKQLFERQKIKYTMYPTLFY
ncbi:hypothetical protein HZC32_00230 [Candidatus Woesearchaeota archaeon]|nr:hypothetical protein [Candidatus Woesearchaeota archaeon]